MIIKYNTRDGNGNDFVKEVAIKEFKKHDVDFVCPVCNKEVHSGCKIKDIVSSSFTDWAYVGDHICEDCTKLFSLYFYNYIVDPNGIRLINVRELKEQLTTPQKPPFLFVITTTQKKHLFYKSRWNERADRYAVNLETETIYTTPGRMKKLFDFVECLQTLGTTKGAMANGELFFQTFQNVGNKALKYLNHELNTSREIQIPLYCGQKREISEEEAICCINSILTM